MRHLTAGLSCSAIVSITPEMVIGSRVARRLVPVLHEKARGFFSGRRGSADIMRSHRTPLQSFRGEFTPPFRALLAWSIT